MLYPIELLARVWRVRRCCYCSGNSGHKYCLPCDIGFRFGCSAAGGIKRAAKTGLLVEGCSTEHKINAALPEFELLQV